MLKELKEKLAAGTSQLAVLKAKAFADGATQADLDALNKHLDTLDVIEEQVKAAERAEKRLADAAKPADGGQERGSAPAQVKAPNTAEEKLALACQSLFLAKSEYGSTSAKNVLKAMQELGYGKAADEFGAINKANTTLTGASGGFLVAENFDRTFIDLLYVQSSFMAGNPRRIPMPEGNYRQAGALTGATAQYRGEGDDIATSNPTFRSIDMSAHLLSAIVPVTNQLLRYSLNEAGSFIRADGAMAMSLKMDQMAYLGSGTGDVPTGIMNLSGINKIAVASATTATPTLAQIEADANKLLGKINLYPALGIGAEWRFAPRSWLYLSTLRNVNDELVYPEMANGMWRGLPARKAGTFPTNLGAGTNETYIALISFGSVLFGEAKGLSIDISSEASYRDGNGDLQSLWSTDSTGFRFMMEHDFDARYVESVNVLTGVKF
ncbi:phage major capsid protein [Mangrovibrevibacter kandeliae]|uniref:phage major capsid protein n=1 Tax=Mangrovibrevibacter kandeliae TaxID=2968473 RepID=UPI0021195A10|nr:phage major capsid protein [Aurantimonas sp. CSK15Z-1]MCQ8781714.1 phage major capsid protein [Aurantimonas sp. CSK15Z-1]